MSKNNRDFFEYEYDEAMHYREQGNSQAGAKYPRSAGRSKSASAKNPNASNQYKNLISRQHSDLAHDAKVYYPQKQNSVHSHNRDFSDGPMSRRPAQSAQNYKTRKKKTGFFGFVKRLFIVLFVLYFAVSAYIFSVVSNINYSRSDSAKNEYVSSYTLKKDLFVKNILFIGVDSRGEENSRSDTMILVSIDKRNRKIKLTSFLRDTYVTVPGHGDMKLNAACFYGGPELVAETIEYNFSIKIDHYMLVDFEAFIDVVDALGGVDVEVTQAEAYYMNNTVKIPSVKQGKNHLNGFITLWYCRIRYLDSDFNRTERQRKVISSILQSAKKQSPFTLAGLAKDVMPYIQTDMSPLELTFLSEGAGLFYLHYDIAQQQVPYSGEYEDRLIDEQLVLYIDKDETARKIKEFIYE